MIRTSIRRITLMRKNKMKRDHNTKRMSKTIAYSISISMTGMDSSAAYTRNLKKRSRSINCLRHLINLKPLIKCLTLSIKPSNSMSSLLASHNRLSLNQLQFLPMIVPPLRRNNSTKNNLLKSLRSSLGPLQLIRSIKSSSIKVKIQKYKLQLQRLPAVMIAYLLHQTCFWNAGNSWKIIILTSQLINSLPWRKTILRATSLFNLHIRSNQQRIKNAYFQEITINSIRLNH